MPSGTTRKNRSRIDFFLISSNLYEYIETCSIAQGFCSKTFDHKPIFLNMKKRKGKGRINIYDDTVNNPLSMDILRCTVHRVTIEQALSGAGIIGSLVLNAELKKLETINLNINDFCMLQGESGTRELTEMETNRLQNMEEERGRLWEETATLEYLRTFERQVEPDLFFELLLKESRNAMITFQNFLRKMATCRTKNIKKTKATVPAWRVV